MTNKKEAGRASARPIFTFEEYYARNSELTDELRGHRVGLIGAGSVASHIAIPLAKAGVDLILLDGDTLDVANLHRHTASAEFIGENKAEALAKTIRSEVPGANVLTLARWLHQLDEDALITFVNSCDVVVCATGDPGEDVRVDWTCQELAVPLVVPYMRGGAGPLLGEVHIVPYSRDRSRSWGMACLTCLHGIDPPQHDRALGTAQAGLSVDVGMIADYTTTIILALLLPDSDRGRWLSRLLDRNMNHFVVPHGRPSLQEVRTERDPHCANCGTPAPARRASHWSLRRTFQMAAMTVFSWIMVVGVPLLFAGPWLYPHPSIIKWGLTLAILPSLWMGKLASS